MNRLFFLLIFTTSSVALQAQTKYKPSSYKSTPVWTQMMQDTAANFNETVKAFRLFFEDRALPHEPGDENGGDGFEKEVGLEEADGAKSEQEIERERKRTSVNEPDYSFEVRAFKGWYYNNKNWLRGDGIIIGPKERQAIIDRQQMELREIERINKKK